MAKGWRAGIVMVVLPILAGGFQSCSKTEKEQQDGICFYGCTEPEVRRFTTPLHGPINVKVPACGVQNIIPVKPSFSPATTPPPVIYAYLKENGVVYYVGDYSTKTPVAGADYNTFTWQPSTSTQAYYGRDKDHVYFKGQVLPGANPATFSYIEKGFGKDGVKAFFGDEEVDEFRFCEWGTTGAYFSDGAKLFYRFEVIPVVNVSETYAIDFGYGVISDGHDVYHGIRPLGADVASFHQIQGWLWADATQVWIEFEIIPGADPKTIHTSIFGSYTMDKNHVYYMTEIVPNADPQTFVELQPPYSRDATQIFCQSGGYRAVPAPLNADAATFVATSLGNAHDKYGSFYWCTRN